MSIRIKKIHIRNKWRDHLSKKELNAKWNGLDYQARIDESTLDICPDCNNTPHDVPERYNIAYARLPSGDMLRKLLLVVWRSYKEDISTLIQ